MKIEPDGKWLVSSERIGPSTSSWRRKLESGEWEPFAITGSDEYGLMWFKRWVSAADEPTPARD